ncbi:hypothetical protein POUND7_015153 [Theobroma cacao]
MVAGLPSTKLGLAPRRLNFELGRPNRIWPLRESRKVGGGDKNDPWVVVKWRKSLFTIFIGNLDKEVEWRPLKNTFDEFEVVMDVFIPRQKGRNDSCYAFVRYREAKEMTRAIWMGHGRRLNGRRIRVMEADK